MCSKIVIFALCTFALACVSASPILVEDEDGQQYYLTPVSHRERRGADGPQLYGGGGANGKTQGGLVGIQNPNGSGGHVGYSHTNGYGQDLSVGAMVPVWSNKNRYGETTLNAGATLQQHFGGPGGNGPLDKQYGLNINHRW